MFFCRPGSRISSRVTNKSQDEVVNMVQTKAECNTDSTLDIPSEKPRCNAALVSAALASVLRHRLLEVCNYTVSWFRCLEESEISS